MNETAFETIASAALVLKLDFSSEEFAGYAEDCGFSEEAIEAVKAVFSYLKEKKQQTTVMTFEVEPVADKTAKDLRKFRLLSSKGKRY